MNSADVMKMAQTKSLVLLAGPCVVEGEDLVMEVAGRVKEIADKLGMPYVFKASYRKANRSRVDSFTGLGDQIGLELIQKVGKTYGIPTVTDIHAADEAAMAAAYVDVLQIPAFLCRQTDLLQAAAATGKVVNIKKGQFLSVRLPRSCCRLPRYSCYARVCACHYGLHAFFAAAKSKQRCYRWKTRTHWNHCESCCCRWGRRIVH